MKKHPLDFLSSNPEERGQVALMLGMGFFFGIFIATYQVTAESLFLNQMSNKLNEAFLMAGILGIVSTYIFTFFQNRVRFIALTISSISVILVITSIVYYLYRFGDPKIHDTVLFIMYCLIGPITAILLLCYWGIFGRLFNFRQSKRIIGWIDTGQLIAIIAANFFVPLTAIYFKNTGDYLVICNVSLVVSLFFIGVIAARFTLTKKIDKTVREETRFVKIFKDRYVVLLAVFLITSMSMFILNQYSFQTLLNQQYPVQRDLTNFIGYFNGTIYLLSLVMQTFINDKLIGTYGLRISLFVLPIVTGIFALGSVIASSIFGYSVSAGQSFIFFFLFVALTRLFNSMLRDSLENPVYKLMFIPLDGRLRFGIQSKIEGVVNESGRFAAGLILFVLSQLVFFKIYWIPVLVIALVGLYLYLVQNLHQGYRNKIRGKLESTEFHEDKLEIGFAQITSTLESHLTDRKVSKAIFSFKLLEKLNPSNVGVWVNALMKNRYEEAQDYAQRRMNEMKGLSVSENYIIRINKSKVTGEGKNILTGNDLEQVLRSGGEITRQRIQKLARSVDSGDRHYAAELLLHSSAPENISFLIELLNDSDPIVRRTALTTASKRFNGEVINSVIENLSNTQFSNLAMNSLALMGASALNYLDAGFYRSGQNTQTMIRIVQVLGHIGGNRAKELLWGKIDYPDKAIVSQVLLSLGECGFKAGISQISRIKYAIETDIADISWNLNAIKELGDSGQYEQVRLALQHEINHDIEHIYMLLAMLYDTRSIQLVKENIESGTSEGTTYAVELLDVFLSEQLKMRVIPVLDDLSESEKIKRLEVFYPRMNLDSKLTLKFLVNRDFTQTNRWTKATVIYQIGVSKIDEFKMDLIAQLFNPDRLIREVAAWSLYQIDPKQYHDNIVRIDEAEIRPINRLIQKGSDGHKQMLYEKILFFQNLSVFYGIPGITLSYLADISKDQQLNAGEYLSVDEKLNNYFFIIYSGSVQYFENSRFVKDFNKGQFVGEMISTVGFANTNMLVAKENTHLLKISKDQFYELLSDHVKLTDKFLQFV
ncbi:MAG TPA: hypothetical protein DGG95_09520 [Cytophagales bacterium]|nr:hypothetical protein [Cytophagales bacterium]